MLLVVLIDVLISYTIRRKDKFKKTQGLLTYLY